MKETYTNFRENRRHKNKVHSDSTHNAAHSQTETDECGMNGGCKCGCGDGCADSAKNHESEKTQRESDEESKPSQTNEAYADKVDADAKVDTNAKTEEKTPSKEEELTAQLAAANDKYLRLAADFDNFRKRSAKESGERTARAVEHFAVEVLDVADNIERALAAEDKSLREGVVQIQKVLTKIMSNHSITPIEAKNTQFDPNKHEAIAYVPSETKEGIVIDEVIRGYEINGKVIRCSKVAVSKGKEE